MGVATLTVIELLGDHGLDPQRVSSGRELAVSCPLCADQSKRMYVNAKTAQWLCFKCEERGGIYWLCRKVLEMDHFEAMHVLDKMPDTHTPDYHSRQAFKLQERRVEPEPGDVFEQQGLMRIELPSDHHLLTTPEAPGERIFWEYLASRAVFGQEIRNHEIGFCLRGYCAYRVIIPVRSNGVLWTFVARDVTGKSLYKVLHPSGALPSRALFGIDKHEGATTVICEGVFDAIKVGTKLAVATLGTNVTPYQRDLLQAKGVKNVILLFDGDHAGHHGANRIVESMITAGFSVKLAVLDDGYDPDTAPFQMIEKAILNAREWRTVSPVPFSAANRLDTS